MAEIAFQKTCKSPRSSESLCRTLESYYVLEQCAPLRHRGRRDKLPDELHRRDTSGVNPGTGTKELQHVLGSRSRSTCSANTHELKQRSSMQKNMRQRYHSGQNCWMLCTGRTSKVPYLPESVSRIMSELQGNGRLINSKLLLQQLQFNGETVVLNNSLRGVSTT